MPWVSPCRDPHRSVGSMALTPFPRWWKRRSLGQDLPVRHLGDEQLMVPVEVADAEQAAFQVRDGGRQHRDAGGGVVTCTPSNGSTPAGRRGRIFSSGTCRRPTRSTGRTAASPDDVADVTAPGDGQADGRGLNAACWTQLTRVADGCAAGGSGGAVRTNTPLGMRPMALPIAARAGCVGSAINFVLPDEPAGQGCCSRCAGACTVRSWTAPRDDLPGDSDDGPADRAAPPPTPARTAARRSPGRRAGRPGRGVPGLQHPVLRPREDDAWRDDGDEDEEEAPRMTRRPQSTTTANSRRPRKAGDPDPDAQLCDHRRCRVAVIAGQFVWMRSSMSGWWPSSSCW